MLLFWVPQIAVNRLIFSYFYFINKQQISNFQHNICFCSEIGLLGMGGNAHNFALAYPNNTSEASTDCGSLALSVLMIVEVSPIRGARGNASPSLWRRGVS